MVKKRHYPPTYYRYYEKHKGVRFTLTTDEYEKIKEMAKKDNVSISDLMRTLVFNFNAELEKIKSTYESEIERIKAEYESEINRLNTEIKKIYNAINEAWKTVFTTDFSEYFDSDYCLVYPIIIDNKIEWDIRKIPKKKKVESENDEEDEMIKLAKMLQRTL